jgi:hypothetical protein
MGLNMEESIDLSFKSLDATSLQEFGRALLCLRSLGGVGFLVREREFVGICEVEECMYFFTNIGGARRNFVQLRDVHGEQRVEIGSDVVNENDHVFPEGEGGVDGESFARNDLFEDFVAKLAVKSEKFTNTGNFLLAGNGGTKKHGECDTSSASSRKHSDSVCPYNAEICVGA